MNCEQWFERLYQFMDRDLDAIAWHEVEAHMKDCRPCYGRYELEVKIRDRLRISCQGEGCTEALRQKIKALLDKY